MPSSGFDKAKTREQIANAVEINPLLRFLGLGSRGRRTLPLNSQIKRVVLSDDAGGLLQSLAKASRVRFSASLAYVEVADALQPTDEILAFLAGASDSEILEQVLMKVEGPGTPVAPGLKALMQQSEPLRAAAIGTLNRLAAMGCAPKAALDAVHPDRHFKVRARLGLAENHTVHPLAKLVAHLFDSDRKLLEADGVFRLLEHRAPLALPAAKALLKLQTAGHLWRLLEHRILRYPADVGVPPFAHPRLEWITSVPQMRRLGEVFKNCLQSDVAYPISLVLGNSFIAVYTSQSAWDQDAAGPAYILEVTPQWVEGAVAYTITAAHGEANSPMPGFELARALADLSTDSGSQWPLNCSTGKGGFRRPQNLWGAEW